MHNSPITTTLRALPLSQAPQNANRGHQEAIDKARHALSRGEIDVAVRDLQAALVGDRQTFHEAILSLLDSSPAQTRQALIEQVHSQQPDLDFNASGKDGKTLLDLAVRHNDLEFADYLLSKGTDPKRVSLEMASSDMQILVTKWRRKNLLYAELEEPSSDLPTPAGLAACLEGVATYLAAGISLGFNQHQENWSVLDQALYEGRFDDAKDLLQEKTAGKKFVDAWEAAIKAGRRDILRAILILGTPEILRTLTKPQHRVGKWQKMLRDDPGLVAVLKELPYQSKLPKNFNGKVRFAKTGQRIVCRDLATYQQEQQARDPSGKIKFDYSQFESLADIATHVKPEISETNKTLVEKAAETHLINNAKFGRFLAKQFASMEKENQPTRLMLVTSTNHMMNLGLRIKEKNGKKSYVVKFFDPNQTTQGTRSKASDLQTLEMQTMEDYIASEELLRAYYPETKGMSLIFVRSEKDAQPDTANVTASRGGKTLTSPIDPEEIDATVMWHLIRNGFDGNLKQLHEHFNTLSDEQRIALLSLKHEDGTPALFKAMQNGYTKTVREYGKLLASIKNISEQDLVDLIAGKRKDGVSALFIAMQEGHAEVVKEYKELLKLLPPAQQVKLLFAKISEGPCKGYDALRLALELREFEAAQEFLQMLTELIPHWPSKMHTSLRQELTNYEDCISELDRGHQRNQSLLQSRWIIKNKVAHLKKELDESGQPAASDMQN